MKKNKNPKDVNGVKYWYNAEGQKHRIGGPAATWPGGGRAWYQNGEFHRINGPAVIYESGDEEWYKNGLRHRTDGPAVIYESGDEEWWINGKRIKPMPVFICELARKLREKNEDN